MNSFKINEFYSLCSKSLSQTLSTDSALDLPVGCNRKISKSASNSKRNSMHSDDNTVTVVGVSSSSSDHDNHEHSAWSSDYSNSEDEYNGTDDISNPVSIFIEYL